MRTAIRLTAPAIAVLVWLAACGDTRLNLVRDAFAAFPGKYVIFVNKKDFTLSVYDRGLRLAARYPVAYGLNPDRKAKLHAGDDRTPTGAYRVVEILSMDADGSTESHRKLSRMNRIFFRARDGHYKYGNPREDLGDNVYGPRFFLLDYPNGDDRRRYGEALAAGAIPMARGRRAAIGHGIAIHGNNDQRSIGHLATSGCVRMLNNDIAELERFIILGTPVIISDE